jgi:hypothetical protein
LKSTVSLGILRIIEQVEKMLQALFLCKQPCFVTLTKPVDIFDPGSEFIVSYLLSSMLQDTQHDVFVATVA